MAQTLGQLLLVLKADTSAFSKGMGDAKKIAFDSAGDIVESLKHVGESLTKLKFDNANNIAASFKMISGLAIGAGVAMAGALAAFTKEGIESAAQMGLLAQKTGVSVETLSAFSWAARQSGVEQEMMVKALEKLSKAMLNQSSSFKTLNIETTDATGRLRPVSDVIGEVAEKLSKMPDGAFKTATAMALFGKSGAELIPFLNRGRDGIQQLTDQASAMGLVIGTETAEAAHKFEQNLNILEARTKSLSLSLANNMLPILNQVGEALSQKPEEGTARFELLSQAVAGLGKVFVTVFGFVQTGFDQLGSYIKNINAALMNMMRLDWAGAKEAMANATREAAQIWNEYTAGTAKMWRGGDMGGAPHEGGKTEPPVVKASPAKYLVDYGNMLDELSKKTDQLAQQSLRAFDKDPLSRLGEELQKHLQKLENFKALHPGEIWADINRQINETKKELQEVNALMDANLRDALAMAGGKSLETFAKGLPGAAIPNASGKTQAQAEELRLQTDVNERNRLGLQIFRETQTATERYAEELRNLNTLQKNGNIDAESYARALARIKAEIGGVRDGIHGFILDLKNTLPTASQQAYGAMATVFRGMHESIRGFARDILMGTKSIGQAFKELGVNIVASMIDAFAEIVAQWIMTHVIMKAITAIFGDGLTSDTNKQIEENMRASASSAALAAIEHVGSDQRVVSAAGAGSYSLQRRMAWA
jgi:hypothetical protein